MRRLGGRYVLYFTVTDTTLNPGDDSAIGVATAPTPLGPWTDSGRPVVPPRPAPGGGFLWTFDPALLTDAQGGNWLYYGSYFGPGRRLRRRDQAVHRPRRRHRAQLPAGGAWWRTPGTTTSPG